MHILQPPGLIEKRRFESVHVVDAVVIAEERALELFVQVADPRTFAILNTAGDLINFILELLKT